LPIAVGWCTSPAAAAGCSLSTASVLPAIEVPNAVPHICNRAGPGPPPRRALRGFSREPASAGIAFGGGGARQQPQQPTPIAAGFSGPGDQRARRGWLTDHVLPNVQAWGAQRPVSALSTFNDYAPVSSLTSFNDGGDSNEVIPAADLLQRRAAALKDRNPGLSMSAAINQALAQPDVRKAYDAERSARLAAASKLHMPG
jgi:hypothetical protein